MADDESLLDVFVKVLPHPDNDDVVKNAVEKTKAMFGTLEKVSVGGGGVARASDELKRGFIEAKRYAEDLAREAGILFRTVKETGDIDISARFQDAMSELKKARTDLARGSQDADPFALDRTLVLLDEVRQKLRQVGGEARVELAPQNLIRDRFRSIVESERQDRPNFNIDSGLRARFTQGLNFDQKKQLQEMIAEARRAEVAFESLKRTFDGSAESLENLSAQSARLKELRQSVLGQLDAVDAGSRSFNTLSNNAYQLGQAFEDAAVGFSLNGFAGAVRGAANNVAFLLNDVSRLQSVQNALPAGWAKQIPLIAGIGSALAITVLPKLIEWLESLDDIELKFRNISNELKASFEDRDIEVSLRVDNRELVRTVEDAKNVQEILQKIRDIDFDVENKRSQLKDIFAGLNEIEFFGDEQTDRQKIESQIDGLFNQVKKRISENLSGFKTDQQAQRDFNDLPNRLLGSAITGFSFGTVETGETETNALRQFRDDIFQLRRQILQAFDLGESGDANAETFVRAQREILKFQEGLAANLERLDVANPEEKVKAVSDTLAEVNGRLQKAEEITREIANAVQNQFSVAFEGARKKVVELQDQLDLNRNVALGLNVDFDLDLFGLNERINEGRDILNEAVDAIRQASKDTGRPVDEAGVASLQEEFKLRSLLSVDEMRKKKIEEIRDTEEDILAIREKQKQSAFTTLEAYSRELQKNVLSDASSATDKRNKELQEQLAKAREDFERLNASRQRVEQNLPFGDVAARRREGLENGPRGRDREDVFGIERERLADDLDRAFERHTERLIEAIKVNTEVTKDLDTGARAK